MNETNLAAAATSPISRAWQSTSEILLPLRLAKCYAAIGFCLPLAFLGDYMEASQSNQPPPSRRRAIQFLSATQDKLGKGAAYALTLAAFCVTVPAAALAGLSIGTIALGDSLIYNTLHRPRGAPWVKGVLQQRLGA